MLYRFPFFVISAIGLAACASVDSGYEDATTAEVSSVDMDASDEDFSASDCEGLNEEEGNAAIEEHVFGGIPSEGYFYVRRAYITEYDEAHRVPRWTAWHAIDDYRITPERQGKWARYPTDPDIDNPVKQDDYDGLHASEDNFARGHLTPYFISGGDRDGDGRFAAKGVGNKTLDDPDDACTVFEVNYMSNITAQYHNDFNGSGGLWYQLESELRDMIDNGNEFHLFAGTIFGDNPQRVGPNNDIGVPSMFYQIVITDQGSVPFLFAHRESLSDEACPLDADLTDCITTIEEIERLTGLDFFSDLTDEEERLYETDNGKTIWTGLLSNLPA